MRSNSDHLTV